MIEQELQELFDYTESLIEELVEDGTNEEVHHTIEHHFSSEDFNALEQAAVTAFKLGLEVEEPEEAETEDGTKVFAFDITTEQALEAEIINAEVKICSSWQKNAKLIMMGGELTSKSSSMMSLDNLKERFYC